MGLYRYLWDDIIYIMFDYLIDLCLVSFEQGVVVKYYRYRCKWIGECFNFIGNFGKEYLKEIGNVVRKNFERGNKFELSCDNVGMNFIWLNFIVVVLFNKKIVVIFQKNMNLMF